MDQEEADDARLQSLYYQSMFVNHKVRFKRNVSLPCSTSSLINADRNHR